MLEISDRLYMLYKDFKKIPMVYRLYVVKVTKIVQSAIRDVDKMTVVCYNQLYNNRWT